MLHQVTDRARLARFMRRDVGLYLYGLGDLDDFFWPHTRWYGWKHAGRLQAVVMLYDAVDPPVLLAQADAAARPALDQLLTALLPQLPPRLYVHGTAGVATRLAARYTIAPAGLYRRMLLRDADQLPTDPAGDVVTLGAADLPALQALYAVAYPDNAFDARMLATGQTVGIWRAGRLVAVAGVHVYSPTYGVAALGNIATDPHWRGQGLGSRVTGVLCHRLLAHVAAIGLNVHADNAAALAVYRRVGFVSVVAFDEFDAVARSSTHQVVPFGE